MLKFNKQNKIKNFIKYDPRYTYILIEEALKAPAVVCVYSCAVLGIMIAFGSQSFHEEIIKNGVAAFGLDMIFHKVILLYSYVKCLDVLLKLVLSQNAKERLIKNVIDIILFIPVCLLFTYVLMFTSSFAAILIGIVLVCGGIITNEVFCNYLKKRTSSAQIEHEFPRYDYIPVSEKLKNGPLKQVKRNRKFR